MSDGTGKIRAIRTQTVSDEIRADLAATLREYADAVESGGVSAMVLVLVCPDGTFTIIKHGELKRLHMMGYLAQAMHDLAHAEQ